MLPTRRPDFSKLPPSTPQESSDSFDQGDPWEKKSISTPEESWDRINNETRKDDSRSYDNQNSDYKYNEKRWS
ncbi:hypothetical protein AYI70_g3609 [Smittium culicis]|uniref:Uncharacterized protein n=1 Tax=Smittium culicis TaxID=133412 RepID=A0A1R1X8D2_9FUNG|nr:hypothetical protein AYI70_g10061 [Smittium culicis]OMJ21203.1 hypothetical protein AYI70_g3609 [Smittium culicis]